MIEQDVLIIGSGGVAGMSAAQYAARAGRSVTLLESIAPGGQTMYIDMIENYPGFDKPISGYEIGMKFHARQKLLVRISFMPRFPHSRKRVMFSPQRPPMGGKPIRQEPLSLPLEQNTATWELKVKKSTTVRVSPIAALVTGLSSRERESWL